MTEQSKEITDLVATEPVEVPLIPVEEFIQQAQSPQFAYEMDAITKKIRDQTGASYRQILRGYGFVLRAIASMMPWDDENGLDANRFHTPSKSMLPSLRDCIGACLSLEFSKTKPDDAPTSPPAPSDTDAPHDGAPMSPPAPSDTDASLAGTGDEAPDVDPEK